MSSTEPSLTVCPEPRGCRADGVPEDCEWCHRLDLESELSVSDAEALSDHWCRIAHRVMAERDELRAEVDRVRERVAYWVSCMRVSARNNWPPGSDVALNRYADLLEQETSNA